LTLPSHSIQRARQTSIERVVEVRGIKLRGRIDCCGPCPNCGGVDRFINMRKQVFNCRGCGARGDVIALQQFLDGCDFRSAVETLLGSTTKARGWRPSGYGKPYTMPDAAEASPYPPQDDAKRDLSSVQRIVSRIIPLIGTPGDVYLRDVRKIDVVAIEDVLSRTDAIGWHPAVHFNQPDHPMHGQRFGCIVAILTDPVTAEPTGAISRTYVGPDLTKIGKPKTLGAPIGIVRLSRDDEVLAGLLLAEGLETVLAGMSIGLRPMWSTGSTALIRSFPVLIDIEAINVVVDNDLRGAGERAARELEARWRAADREVNLFRSDAPSDLNDALRGIVR
jgi:Toprim domain/CHC2 zinc finger